MPAKAVKIAGKSLYSIFIIMKSKAKYGKIFIVVFLTVLIWVWADLALDEDFSVYRAKISVAKSSDPDYWVSFENDNSSINIKKLVLRGSASKVAKVSRALGEGTINFDLFWEPESSVMTDDSYVLDLADFLKSNSRIRQLGLTVKSCDPNMIDVKIVKLVSKTLKIKCIDDDQGGSIVDAIIEPSHIDMAVPDFWGRENYIAWVNLTKSEISNARLSAIEKKPFIELSSNVRRTSSIPVKISMPEEKDRLIDCTITAKGLGICLSPNLQGKYKVEITNLDTVYGFISIKATEAAKRAYESTAFQIMLLIEDDVDKESGKELRQKVVYNFPEDFVRRGEIMLQQPAAEARFVLKPISSSQ